MVSKSVTSRVFIQHDAKSEAINQNPLAPASCIQVPNATRETKSITFSTGRYSVLSPKMHKFVNERISYLK